MLILADMATDAVTIFVLAVFANCLWKPKPAGLVIEAETVRYNAGGMKGHAFEQLRKCRLFGRLGLGSNICRSHHEPGSCRYGKASASLPLGG